MGMDYRYLLFFERAARLDVLEHLAEIGEHHPEHQTVLVDGDRELTLPFKGWIDTGPRISSDDSSRTWDFMTTLCFEADDALLYYLERLERGFGRGADDNPRDLLNAQGRAAIGYVYLSVHNDMSDWPMETGEDLVLFEFGTPGSSMSVLFTESDSIRRSFVHLLATCRGVYGLLDMEDTADLIWWRGEEMSERLPTAQIPLAEIERIIGRRD
jgi:hypothetical protein